MRIFFCAFLLASSSQLCSNAIEKALKDCLIFRIYLEFASNKQRFCTRMYKYFVGKSTDINDHKKAVGILAKSAYCLMENSNQAEFMLTDCEKSMELIIDVAYQFLEPVEIPDCEAKYVEIRGEIVSIIKAQEYCLEDAKLISMAASLILLLACLEPTSKSNNPVLADNMQRTREILTFMHTKKGLFRYADNNGGGLHFKLTACFKNIFIGRYSMSLLEAGLQVENYLSLLDTLKKSPCLQVNFGCYGTFDETVRDNFVLLSGKEFDEKLCLWSNQLVSISKQQEKVNKPPLERGKYPENKQAENRQTNNRQVENIPKKDTTPKAELFKPVAGTEEENNLKMNRLQSEATKVEEPEKAVSIERLVENDNLMAEDGEEEIPENCANAFHANLRPNCSFFGVPPEEQQLVHEILHSQSVPQHAGAFIAPSESKSCNKPPAPPPPRATCSSVPASSFKPEIIRMAADDSDLWILFWQLLFVIGFFIGCQLLLNRFLWARPSRSNAG